MTTYEVISLIIQAVGLLSIVFLVLQIFLSEKSTKGHYEEQRRVNTIQVLSGWNNCLKKESRLSEKIVETLNERQCKELYDYNSFYVSEKTHDMLCQMCSKGPADCGKCQKNGRNEYLVSGVLLTELRGNVTNYLNNLEIVALAWQQAIVDRDALVMQFSYLHTPGVKSALKKYRDVAGNGNSYPALAEFYDTIREKNKVRAKKKKPQ